MRRWVPPLALCFVVAALAQVPPSRNGLFYLVDDSAAQFVPMWRRIGEQLLSGHFPLLDLDSWAGGNLAGEALFGLWNPVNLLDYVLVTRFEDLAVAATVVKTQYLVILALGVYLLCREYGAAKWAAFSLAVALPFSGFILYFQAGTWAAGLMTFAWVPYAWWSARKAARRAGHPIWAFVFGALCVTAGNPYGVVAILLVYIGLYGELRQRRTVLIALSVLAVAPLVFLPLMGAAAVGVRNGLQFYNTGDLSPGIEDLLALSVPSHLPEIKGFEPGSTRLLVPATYFAWFAAPVLAWVDWRALKRRDLAGVLVFTGTYFLLCLAPSNIWMFRWPLRNIEGLFLGVSVLLAVLLSAGFRTDHLRRRMLITGGALLAGAYLAVASWPKLSPRHLIALVLVAGLTALLLKVRQKAVVLVGGTAVVLVLQTTWT
ncbi:MAG: GtrA family protein, partial [Kibdelosporangium sp.]